LKEELDEPQTVSFTMPTATKGSTTVKKTVEVANYTEHSVTTMTYAKVVGGDKPLKQTRQQAKKARQQAKATIASADPPASPPMEQKEVETPAPTVAAVPVAPAVPTAPISRSISKSEQNLLNLELNPPIHRNRSHSEPTSPDQARSLQNPYIENIPRTGRDTPTDEICMIADQQNVPPEVFQPIVQAMVPPQLLIKHHTIETCEYFLRMVKNDEIIVNSYEAAQFMVNWIIKRHV
jgi:hypothetical protein